MITALANTKSAYYVPGIPLSSLNILICLISPQSYELGTTTIYTLQMSHKVPERELTQK